MPARPERGVVAVRRDQQAGAAQLILEDAAAAGFDDRAVEFGVGAEEASSSPAASNSAQRRCQASTTLRSSGRIRRAARPGRHGFQLGDHGRRRRAGR